MLCFIPISPNWTFLEVQKPPEDRRIYKAILEYCWPVKAIIEENFLDVPQNIKSVYSVANVSYYCLSSKGYLEVRKLCVFRNDIVTDH